MEYLSLDWISLETPKTKTFRVNQAGDARATTALAKSERLSRLLASPVARETIQPFPGSFTPALMRLQSFCDSANECARKSGLRKSILWSPLKVPLMRPDPQSVRS
mmetsp:Transcript_74522/g.222320  ORF Transcript_74522/g.222320 Transcript_74522/m.222320 type:complete len:106 (+) Transcript_74522:248-565(+)